ncbi:MAG: ATP-binding cassette domain-containing protein [Candidatus Nomurabacteria bacterium]|nr:ATP-binding cassette domain-containing protein [Candidatus Nomurabacteria bacterium]
MIEVKNLKKVFIHKGKEIVAVDNISFSIAQGETVALIGPNGAGKSTTIKMLTGILHPTKGEVSVLGLSPQNDRKKVVNQIGAVFGQRSSLLPNLPPRDTLNLFGIMYGLSKKEIKERIETLENTLDMKSFADQPIRTLSLGQRMRVEIACAIIHNPKILFLDEPSIGLDIIAKQTLRETLLSLRSEHNMTIFLTSHDVGDIEAICDRTIIVNHGKIVVDEPTNELHKLIEKEKHVEVRGPSLEDVLVKIYKQ